MESLASRKVGPQGVSGSRSTGELVEPHRSRLAHRLYTCQKVLGDAPAKPPRREGRGIALPVERGKGRLPEKDNLETREIAGDESRE